jgi:hypothetical protein
MMGEPLDSTMEFNTLDFKTMDLNAGDQRTAVLAMLSSASMSHPGAA